MKRRIGMVVAVALALPLVSVSTVTADGEPVPGFGVNGVVIDSSWTNGRQPIVDDVIQTPDGSFAITGVLVDGGPFPNPTPFVVRYSAAGQLDRSFGTNGVVVPAQRPGNLALLSDGRLITPGVYLAGGRAAAIASDGSLVPGPGFAGFVSDLIEEPDGSIIAVGGFQVPGSASAQVVAMLVRPDGTTDPTFVGDVASIAPPRFAVGGSLGPGAQATSATLLSDGRLIVGFRSFELAGIGNCRLTALTALGTIDTTFGSGGVVVADSGCEVDHFVDNDDIRVTGSTSALSYSQDGDFLGELTSTNLARPDLEFEGIGTFYSRTGESSITAFDPFGDIDTTFGASGVATLSGVRIDGFELLDSGDLVAWGIPTAHPLAFALGRIHASFGTAPQPPALDTSKFVPVSPIRILDTREGLGAAKAKLGAGGQIDLQIAGQSGVPNADISAVVLNVTATDATQAGFVTAFPSGGRRPNSSNLNVERPGQTAANLVTVKVGSNGKVTLFSSGGTHLVADVAGYYTPAVTSTAGRLQTAAPQRILDTREGLGAAKAKLPAGGQIDLQVAGAGPVPPSGVSAVVLNVTADQATADAT